jgi:hypothetical protein
MSSKDEVIDINHIKRQLEILKTPFCPLDWASEKYGINFLAEDQLTGRFRKWAIRFKNRKDVMTSVHIDRFAFELFLQHSKLIPLKYASIQLGMSEESLKTVIKKMQTDGEFPYLVDLDSSVIEGSLIENLVQMFPQLDKTIFNSQPELCKGIHEAIKTELEINVEPIFCKTSKLIDESPDYAYEYDALTAEPMSIKYQLWLDLGKPIILKPDACSMLTYFQCKDNVEINLLGNYDDRIRPIEERIRSKIGDK